MTLSCGDQLSAWQSSSISRRTSQGYTDGNCEHDMTYAQAGVPSSPSVNTVIGLSVSISLTLLVTDQW
jgi:hypothetical protein